MSLRRKNSPTSKAKGPSAIEKPNKDKGRQANEIESNPQDLSGIEKASIGLEEAADYVRNYYRKMNGLSSRRNDRNTRYLWISIERLVQMINKWNGAELVKINPEAPKNLDTIRLYPMIYKKDFRIAERGSMLNLCLVPAKGDNEISPSGFENGNFINTFGDIENEIGQCPPQCRPGNNILLAAALDLTGPETSD